MTRRTVAALAAALLAVSCSGEGGATVPAGFQVLEHPSGSVAVPEEWAVVDDTSGRTEDDPDAIRTQVPSAPEDQQIGVTLFQTPGTLSDAEGATVLYSSVLMTAGAGDQTRREEIEVPGTTHGHLLQVEAEGRDGDIFRGTYVAGRREDGVTLVVRLLGTEEQIPDETIDQIVESFEVTGG